MIVMVLRGCIALPELGGLGPPWDIRYTRLPPSAAHHTASEQNNFNGSRRWGIRTSEWKDVPWFASA
jgi:hypothetical protein